jgi:hypothetical protein
MTNRVRAAKRTYTLPAETIERFERVVPSGDRSHTIDRLLRQELQEIEKQRIRNSIIEAAEYMSDVYAETTAEWEKIGDETWPSYE